MSVLSTLLLSNNPEQSDFDITDRLQTISLQVEDAAVKYEQALADQAEAECSPNVSNKTCNKIADYMETWQEMSASILRALAGLHALVNEYEATGTDVSPRGQEQRRSIEKKMHTRITQIEHQLGEGKDGMATIIVDTQRLLQQVQ